MVLVAASSVGWVGAVGTVGAYALVSQRRLEAHSLRFQMTNAICAALLALSALSARSWPSMVSNLVWMGIGVHALLGSRQALRAAVADRLRAVRLHRDDEPPAGSTSADEVFLCA